MLWQTNVFVVKICPYWPRGTYRHRPRVPSAALSLARFHVLINALLCKHIYHKQQILLKMLSSALFRTASGLVVTAALSLLAGAPGALALSAFDAQNLTRTGYIYTYPTMLTYRQMYAVRDGWVRGKERAT